MHSVNLHEHARKKSFSVQLLGNSDGGEEKKHVRLTFEEGEVCLSGKTDLLGLDYSNMVCGLKK